MSDWTIEDQLQLTREIVARYELRNSPIKVLPTRVQIEYGDDISIVVPIEVPHRDTGEATRVYHAISQSFVPNADMAKKVTEREYEALLRRVFDHEFEEAFHVDGKRVLDPHLEIGGRYEGQMIVAIERLGGYRRRLTLEDKRQVEVP